MRIRTTLPAGSGRLLVQEYNAQLRDEQIYRQDKLVASHPVITVSRDPTRTYEVDYYSGSVVPNVAYIAIRKNTFDVSHVVRRCRKLGIRFHPSEYYTCVEDDWIYYRPIQAMCHNGSQIASYKPRAFSGVTSSSGGIVDPEHNIDEVTPHNVQRVGVPEISDDSIREVPIGKPQSDPYRADMGSSDSNGSTQQQEPITNGWMSSSADTASVSLDVPEVQVSNGNVRSGPPIMYIQKGEVFFDPTKNACFIATESQYVWFQNGRMYKSTQHPQGFGQIMNYSDAMIRQMYNESGPRQSNMDRQMQEVQQNMNTPTGYNQWASAGATSSWVNNNTSVPSAANMASSGDTYYGPSVTVSSGSGAVMPVFGTGSTVYAP